MAPVVRVIFEGDDRGAVRTTRAVDRAIGGLGGTSRRTTPILASLGKVAALGVGAAFAGLALARAQPLE